MREPSAARCAGLAAAAADRSSSLMKGVRSGSLEVGVAASDSMSPRDRRDVRACGQRRRAESWWRQVVNSLKLTCNRSTSKMRRASPMPGWKGCHSLHGQRR